MADEDFSFDSRIDSYKPPTPGLAPPDEEDSLPIYKYQKPPTTGSSIAPSELANLDPAAVSHEFLEEKRRRALREREREQAAKQRQRELLSQKREQELKKKIADDNLRREQQAAVQASIDAQDKEREDRRFDQMQRKEEELRKEEEERRKMAMIEKKREQSLRHIEMQRLREEETQRMKREQILNKRKEMERVRDQAERLYADKKKEEMARKLSLVDEMKRKREQRLVDLEKRRNNPLLVQQEREFNQLIELQASVGRLQTKLEETQTRREDVRERLLEARHVVEMLEIEERQIGISIEEVESDLKKLKGYQDGLSRLVSTRYDDDEYEKSVVLIQKVFRGRKDWKIGKKLKEQKEARELEDAAIKIQKIQRGRRIRIMQKDDAMVKSAVKIQSMFRGRKSRQNVVSMRHDMQAHAQFAMEKEGSTTVQNAFRCFLARKALRHLREESFQKQLAQEHITQQAQKPPPKKSSAGKKGGKGSRPPPGHQHKERGKDGLVRRERSKDAPVGPGKVLPARKQAAPEKRRAEPAPRAREPVPSGGFGTVVRKEERRIGGELGRIYASTPRDRVGAGQTPRARRFVPTAATAAAAQTAEELGGFSFIRSGVQSAFGEQTAAALPDAMKRPGVIQSSMNPRAVHAEG